MAGLRGLDGFAVAAGAYAAGGVGPSELAGSLTQSFSAYLRLGLFVCVDDVATFVLTGGRFAACAAGLCVLALSVGRVLGPFGSVRGVLAAGFGGLGLSLFSVELVHFPFIGRAGPGVTSVATFARAPWLGALLLRAAGPEVLGLSKFSVRLVPVAFLGHAGPVVAADACASVLGSLGLLAVASAAPASVFGPFGAVTAVARPPWVGALRLHVAASDVFNPSTFSVGRVPFAFLGRAGPVVAAASVLAFAARPVAFAPSGRAPAVPRDHHSSGPDPAVITELGQLALPPVAAPGPHVRRSGPHEGPQAAAFPFGAAVSSSFST